MRLTLLPAALFLFVAPAFGRTNLTGDIVNGYPVITSLDLNDTPANAITRYYFLAGEAQGTILYHVPVFVARGTEASLDTGRKLSLSSAVHGDELNGIRVVQKVFDMLEEYVSAGSFNGTVIGIPTLNINGIMHNQRNFYSSSENGFLTNLNRVFPGENPDDPEAGASLPEGYAYRIWTHLWGNTSNVDVAVDLHTLSTGSNGPMWAYADYRLPYVARLAQLAQPDIIKIDPGEPGSIETTWVENSIPAITLELGPPVSWSQPLIQRGQDFVFRLLADLKMIPSNTTIEPDLSNTYVANTRTDVISTKAGFAEALVEVLDDVTEGQEIVRVYNSWGDVVESVRSPSDARVLQVKTDPAVEQGAVVVVLVYNSTQT